MPLTNISNPKLSCSINLVATSIKHTYISTRSSLSFTVLNIGLFLHKNLMIYKNITNNDNVYRYKLRKTLYTFPKPNQIKNSILRRKSSIVLFKFLYKNHNNLRNSTNYLNPNLQPKSHEHTFKVKSLLNTLLLGYRGNNARTPKILFSPHQTNREVSPSDIGTGDIKITRVKFKPGYQRLWRDSRSALKDLIGLNFIYQKQLTKYLVKFYRKTSLSFFSQNELSLYKLIIYSRISPDYNTFNLFYSSKLFFLNGFLPTSKDIICVINDFIQLVVSKWYYIFFR